MRDAQVSFANLGHPVSWLLMRFWFPEALKWVERNAGPSASLRFAQDDDSSNRMSFADGMRFARMSFACEAGFGFVAESDGLYRRGEVRRSVVRRKLYVLHHDHLSWSFG